MKAYFFFFIAILFVACADEKTPEKSIQEIQMDSNAGIIRNPISADGVQDTINVAKIEFVETNYDFGTVEEGEVVKKTFSFTNIGKAPLLISDARSTCGCTVADYPKEPIAPGEAGEIEVNFNTIKKRNRQKKVVTLTANTYPAETKVALEGFVNPAEVVYE
ncbi:MAG: DUF1573 domain-containing protein [Saprospiraceae bacterium]